MSQIRIRLSALLLCPALLFCLSACGASFEVSEPEETAAEAEPLPEETGSEEQETGTAPEEEAAEEEEASEEEPEEEVFEPSSMVGDWNVLISDPGDLAGWDGLTAELTLCEDGSCVLAGTSLQYEITQDTLRITDGSRSVALNWSCPADSQLDCTVARVTDEKSSMADTAAVYTFYLEDGTVLGTLSNTVCCDSDNASFSAGGDIWQVYDLVLNDQRMYGAFVSIGEEKIQICWLGSCMELTVSEETEDGFVISEAAETDQDPEAIVPLTGERVVHYAGGAPDDSFVFVEDGSFTAQEDDSSLEGWYCVWKGMLLLLIGSDDSGTPVSGADAPALTVMLLSMEQADDGSLTVGHVSTLFLNSELCDAAFG